MITVNAMGDACPIPVVKTKKAIQSLTEGGVVETLVDNEIAVQNLTKMAVQKGYGVSSEQVAENQYKVVMTIDGSMLTEMNKEDEDPVECTVAVSKKKKKIVAVFSSAVMGVGADDLGAQLIKGFIYAMSQQEQLPDTMLFYNGGARLTTEGSASLEDLKAMADKGVEILTCGTCLNHYGLTEKLAVGEVTNMYVIVEKMCGADLIVKP